MTPDEYQRLGRVLEEAERDGSVWPPTSAAIRLLVLTGCRLPKSCRCGGMTWTARRASFGFATPRPAPE